MSDDNDFTIWLLCIALGLVAWAGYPSGTNKVPPSLNTPFSVRARHDVFAREQGPFDETYVGLLGRYIAYAPGPNEGVGPDGVDPLERLVAARNAIAVLAMHYAALDAPQQRRALAMLTIAIRHPNARVRVSACQAVARERIAEAYPAVLELANDADQAVRGVVAVVAQRNP